MGPDIRQSAVDYLLGELPPEDADRFEAGLQIDPALRAEVDRLRPVVGRLEGRGEEAWAPLEPPPLDLAAIVAADSAPVDSDPVAEIASGEAGEPREASPEAAPASGGKPPLRPRRSLTELFGVTWPRVAVGAFSALFMLAVGVGVGLQLGGDSAVSEGEPVQTVQLQAFGDEAPADASGEVLMTSGGDGTGDQMTLDVSGLEQSGDREFYELWLLGEKGELIALGSFRVPPDGSSTIEVPLPVDPDRYRYFDVSIQPENGDPQHSGRSVLRGLTRS
jgi:anti-sigma-K factor RskA